jgi:hypothetical protein
MTKPTVTPSIIGGECFKHDAYGVIVLTNLSIKPNS